MCSVLSTIPGDAAPNFSLKCRSPFPPMAPTPTRAKKRRRMCLSGTRERERTIAKRPAAWGPHLGTLSSFSLFLSRNSERKRKICLLFSRGQGGSWGGSCNWEWGERDLANVSGPIRRGFFNLCREKVGLTVPNSNKGYNQYTVTTAYQLHTTPIPPHPAARIQCSLSLSLHPSHFPPFVVPLPAVTFLEYWKRKSASLAHHWDCMGFQEEDERPRPDFAAKAPYLEKNPITGIKEPR